MKKQQSDPAKPSQPNVTGGLIPAGAALLLSQQLFMLADQWPELCLELETAGYGVPSRVERDAIEALAATDEARIRLRAFWREWGRERLAGLAGPMNILRGRYPPVTAYRSLLIAELRDELATGKIVSEGSIVSPQIEPTLKHYIERPPDCSAARQLSEEIKQARQQAASTLHLLENSAFTKLGAGARYELLIERYRMALEPAGFTLDSHR
jgi:hypothetical protein